MDNNIFNFTDSPKDYSDDLYLVYLELGAKNDTIKLIIQNYCTIEKELEFGYLCQVAIQNVPEIIRSLANENHAVYQAIRLVKLSHTTQINSQ